MPSFSGWIRLIFPRRSLVLPDVRWASYWGLRPVRSSIGAIPAESPPELVLSPTAKYRLPAVSQLIEPAEWQHRSRSVGHSMSVSSLAGSSSRVDGLKVNRLIRLTSGVTLGE